MSYDLLAEQRHLYGNVYLTIFPDGQLIPWHTLQIQEVLQYSREIARDHFPRAVLEDEIFKKCVLNPYYVRNLEFLKAGVVNAVVEAIWEFSAPQTPDQLTQDLDNLWKEQQGDYRVIYDFMSTILLAFPYKPEEVGAMSYEEMMRTLVLADRKLIELGIRKEPTKIVVDQPSTPPPSKPKIDAKALWEAKHFEPQQDHKQNSKDTGSNKQGKWYKVSPILEVPPTHNVKLDEENPDIFALGGHEKQDLPLQRAMMIEDAKIIYRDVIKALEQRQSTKK